MTLLARAWIGAARARRRLSGNGPADDHAPNPLLTLGRLRALCRERLVLRSAALPDLPGAPGACVFYPAGGAAYVPAAAGVRAIGLTEAFDPTAAYGKWWWGITPSALRVMLEAAGFAVEELRLEPFLVTVIAR